MKKRLGFISAFVLYLAMLTVLMRFDLTLMIQPLPLACVAAGIVILTLFRYKKGMPLRRVLKFARWNALFSGALISLLSLLSAISKGAVNTAVLLRNIVPLIYGMIVYMFFSLVLSFTKSDRGTDSGTNDLLNTETALPVFRQKGFSERECHVALKLLEGLPNKQIASQLYISESTVKKHIQNLFRKCGAADRHDFIRLYTQWVKDQNIAIK